MTREDVQDFLAMVQAAYPNYRPENKTAAINVWLMALGEYDNRQTVLGLKAYITSNASGFAPAPGQIIDKIQMISEPEELNEMEAWSLVSKAIRNSGYNYVEEFAGLPPLVQKAVGLPDQLRTWALDENYSEEVNSSNFMKCYRAVLQRQKEINRMPEKVRRLIEEVNRSAQSAQIEEKKKMAIEAKEDRERRENALEENKKNGLSEIVQDILRKFKEGMHGA